MIAIELPAVMECDQEGCKARLSIALVLNAGGTLAPRLPKGNGWQVGMAPNGVLIMRCPLHHALVETPPRIGLEH